jgi:hypothetical protein
MRICLKCSAYYADDSTAFCLLDGTPLVKVDPGSDNWSEGARVVEEKETSLRKQIRKLKWRRVLVTATTLLIAALVLCVVTINAVIYLKPPQEETSMRPPSSPTPTPTPTATPTPTPTLLYKITGRVMDAGQPVGGVKIMLRGTMSASTTTGADGKYVFRDLPAGASYTINPDPAAKMKFTEIRRTIDSLTRDEAADFFVEHLYKISGQVKYNGKPAPGVGLELSGPKSGSAKTGDDGGYTFSDLPAGGPYTILPRSSADLDFEPSRQRIESLKQDQSVPDFFGYPKRRPTPTPPRTPGLIPAKPTIPRTPGLGPATPTRRKIGRLNAGSPIKAARVMTLARRYVQAATATLN